MKQLEVTSGRILAVYNEYSTRAHLADQGVRRPLEDLGLSKGQVESHILRFPRVEDNIADLSELIREGDTILSVGGDGTYHTVGNAALRAALEGVRVGLVGYGNFNDGARTFNQLEDLRNPLPLLDQNARTVDVHPIETMIDNELWRQAFLYMSIGRTAELAAIFNDPEVRSSLLSGESSMVKNFRRLISEYFRTRNDGYIPPFCHLGDDDTVHSNVTDVVNVNGPIMARFARSGKDMHKTDAYIQSCLDISRLYPNLPFILKSLLGCMPGREIESDTMKFVDLSVVPLQADGESDRRKGVGTIRLQKTPGAPALQVITAKL